jgi:hypothetical protein
MGMSLRHDEKREHLIKCRQLEIENKLYYEKLLEEAHNKQDSNFDPLFGEIDQQTALKKLKKAAIKYNKNHPSSMGLGGFVCKYLTPGAFREMVKVTFQLMLSNKELGALVHQFDVDKNGTVRCDNFLLYFLSLGAKERSYIWTASLEKQRRECYEQAMEQERILKAQWERAGSIKIEEILKFTKADEDSALKKIGEAAKFYDKNASESDLMRAFEGQSMTPSVFKEMMKRCFNVTLTNPELGACLVLFDQIGDRSQIHCGLFCVKFTSLGFLEKEKARTEQRERRQKAEAAIAEQEARQKAEAAKEFDVSVVDYNFSEKDREFGLKKLALGAGRCLMTSYVSFVASAPLPDNLPKRYDAICSSTDSLLFLYFTTGAGVSLKGSIISLLTDCSSFPITFSVATEFSSPSSILADLLISLLFLSSFFSFLLPLLLVSILLTSL